MPKVSIIVLTHNRADFLAKAVRSILDQTFQDFEVVLVDDASTDGTRELIKTYSDPRIKYVRHEVNRGEAAARNTGLKHSSGHYIAFLDDDDEWLPQKLEKQVHLMDCCPEVVGGVYTGLLEIDRRNNKVVAQKIPEKRGDIFEAMSLQNWVGTPSTVLLRKKCFNVVGEFDETIDYGPDYDMWIRVSKKFHFELISEPLVHYSVHQSRLSTNCAKAIPGLEAQLKKYGEYFSQNRKTHSDRYFSLGTLYCLNCESRKGKLAYLKAIRLYPFRIKSYLFLCLSMLGGRAFRKLAEAKARGRFLLSP